MKPRNNKTFPIIFSSVLFMLICTVLLVSNPTGDNKGSGSAILDDPGLRASANPGLINPNVNPAQGINTTVFNFTVNYVHPDNILPTSIIVTINGSSTPMTAAVPGDMNVVDGKIYCYTTTLAWGMYQFRMDCSDGVTINSTSVQPGPAVNPFLIPQLTTIFYDNFNDGSLGTDWSIMGYGGVSSITYNSSPYCGYHNGIAGEVTSRIISLSAYPAVNLSYWVRRGAAGLGELPDSGEDMIVEYYSNANTWLQLDVFFGGGTGGTIYTRNTMLPANALHANFRIRFRQTTGSGSTYDYWFFDDVLLRSGSSGRVILLTNPANGSTFLNGLVDFAWTSIAPRFGPITYTWQLSNRSDFATIVKSVSGIAETPTTTQMSTAIAGPNGIYYWRVRAVYNVFAGNWTVANALYVIVNDNAPALTMGSVSPGTGNQFTTFTFSVNYTDVDNNSPVNISVYINGTMHAMAKQNPADMNYADGCIFQYTASFVHVTSNYTYYFSCHDGRYANMTANYVGPCVVESNTNAPQLLGAQVSPIIGSNTTMFNFSVQYFDTDNNIPSSVTVTVNTTVYTMIEVNPADKNVVDGKIYYYITTLPWGTYRSRFNCSDGTFGNSTGWINAPESNPFSSLGQKTIRNVAIFRDALPWGINEVVPRLMVLGITYTIYGSSSFGVVSLAPFDKVIIESYQVTSFYTALTQPSVRAWLEAYVASGGIFQMHHWQYGTGNDILGTLPGGYTDIASSTDTIVVNASYASHPIMTGVTGAGLSGLTYSSESYLTGLTGIEKILAYDNSVLKPRLFTRAFGAGLMIYVSVAIEWGAYYNRGTYGTLLDNLLQYGEASPGVVSLVLPSNGTTVYNGNVNFIWSSLRPSFGPITYEWQISNTSSFTAIFDTVTGIPETMVTTTMQHPVNFTTGQYYWRVRGEYGPLHGNWSAPFVLNIIHSDYAPTLTSGAVDPLTGSQFTSFNFTVVYSDADNNPPTSITVSINGSSHSMQKQNPGDNNYADGCLYQFQTVLIFGGNYEYNFSCTDGRFITSTPIYTGLSVVEINTNTPWFSSVAVTPVAGSNQTIFNFTVVYNDADNNHPHTITVSINGTVHSMIAANIIDMDVMDGKLYYYATTLPWGKYQYQINCSDGIYQNSTSWINNPEVNPFLDSQLPMVEYHPWNGAGSDYGYGVWTSGTSIYTVGYTSSLGVGGYDLLLVKWGTNMNVIWNRTWGGSNNDYGYAVWGDGTFIYTVGRTYSYGNGNGDIVLVKWNADGNVQWYQTWGGSDYEYAYGVCGDGTSIYVCGFTESYGAGLGDYVIVKWDASGAFQWYRTWGGSSDDYAYSICIQGGDLFATGYTYSYGAGGYDLALVKYTTDGTFQWYRTWGGTNSDYGHGVWANGQAIYTSGYTASYGAGNYDMVLVKWDTAGTVQWYRTWGGSNYDYSMSIWGTGNKIFVGGYASVASSYDFVAVQWNSDGVMKWNATWGGSSDDYGQSLWGSGAFLYMAGYTYSFGLNTPNLVLVKFKISSYMSDLISPVNGTIVPNNNAAFHWSNVSPPAGFYSYHWQVSNTSTFSTILAEFDGIPEGSPHTSITLNLSSFLGTAYWRVRPEYGPFAGNWSLCRWIRLIDALPTIIQAPLPWIYLVEGSAANITLEWVLRDADLNGPYSIYRSDHLLVVNQTWYNDVAFSITHVVNWTGGMRFTLEYSDNHALLFYRYDVIVFVDDIPRVLHTPANTTVVRNSIYYLDWTLIDITGSGNYSMYRNGSLIASNRSWVQKISVHFLVDTNQEPGVYEFTIEFVDMNGNEGITSTVQVIIVAQNELQANLFQQSWVWLVLIIGGIVGAFVLATLSVQKVKPSNAVPGARSSSVLYLNPASAAAPGTASQANRPTPGEKPYPG
nr:hypothetical protein [Candidatus Sigynarchaeota archaeon]